MLALIENNSLPLTKLLSFSLGFLGRFALILDRMRRFLILATLTATSVLARKASPNLGGVAPFDPVKKQNATPGRRVLIAHDGAAESYKIRLGSRLIAIEGNTI
jgi:hypothetical protein